MKNEFLFFEKQRFSQWWIWLILIGIDAIFVIGIIQQIAMNKPFGNNPMSDFGLILTLMFVLSLTVLFFFFRLDTYITQDGIYVRFFPFHLSFKYYSWESISKAYVRKYAPIKEYGGWGYRTGGLSWKFKNGTFRTEKALNVSGNVGLQLEFINNRNLLIGTNRPQEMKEVLMKLGKYTE